MEREFQFYIVPTPIGNLDDISKRAIDVLKSVDIVACEDSRTTQNLLNYYKISTKLISYHKFNEKKRVELIMSYLNQGLKIALVSDAGTPMICDPGSILVKELRKNNISITALPGASALITFLSQIPRDTEEFTFIGFLPKSDKKIGDIFLQKANQNVVFYDSPNRILNTLNVIKQVRGQVKIALSRELTKLFEETVVDDIDSIISHYKDGIKGELVCMVFASDNKTADLTDKIKLLKDNGYTSKDISSILSLLYSVNKNDIYKESLKL